MRSVSSMTLITRSHVRSAVARRCDLLFSSANTREKDYVPEEWAVEMWITRRAVDRLTECHPLSDPAQLAGKPAYYACQVSRFGYEWDRSENLRPSLRISARN